MQSTVWFIAIIKINGRCKVKPKSIIISYLYLILIPLSIISYLLQYCYDKFHDFNENFALLAFMSMFGRLTAFLQQAAEVTSQVVSKMSSLLLWFGTFAINHHWASNRKFSSYCLFLPLFIFLKFLHLNYISYTVHCQLAPHISKHEEFQGHWKSILDAMTTDDGMYLLKKIIPGRQYKQIYNA